MKILKSLPNILEVLIITYDRCDFLKGTLRALSNSPFSDCLVSVLDNCSPDATQEVVAEFSTAFPRLNYVRNRINIGGNPNYLKAIEKSAAEYTWILCDDDFLDFSDCDDVVEAIVSQRYDLIEVGANEEGKWPRGKTTTVKGLVDAGVDYHNGFSFFPAYIFRTALFDSECFCWGYKNIDNLYPQFAFLNKSLEENFSIYLCRHRIVIRNKVCDNSFLPLRGYASWIACCRSIPERKIRTQAIEDYTADRSFVMCLGFWTVLERKLARDGFFLRVAGILHAMSFRQRMRYLAVLPWTFLPFPLRFWVWGRTKIYKLMKTPEDEIPKLTFVDRG